MEYTEMLDLPFETPQGITTAREFYSRMGSPEFDFAKYRDSGMLEAILGLSENMILNSENSGQLCPATIEYWEKRGLKKQYVCDADGDYVLFTPLSMKSGSERRYPLIFTICGANDDLYLTETLGFTHLAAEEEFIQVIPVLLHPERNPSIDRERPYVLARKLMPEFPVDDTRIYMTGFSHGGILTQWNCIAHADIFAGGAASGIRPGDGAPKRVWQSFMASYEYPVTEETAKMHAPLVYCIGMAEQPQHLPLYRGTSIEHFEHYVDEHVELLRYITRVNETAELTIDDLMACEDSEDASERAIGIPLINTHNETYFGARHYFGDVPSRDGLVRTRYIGVENQPHHPSAAWAKLSWDFLKHFTRDPVTHESVYTE